MQFWSLVQYFSVENVFMNDNLNTMQLNCYTCRLHEYGTYPRLIKVHLTSPRFLVTCKISPLPLAPSTLISQWWHLMNPYDVAWTVGTVPFLGSVRLAANKTRLHRATLSHHRAQDGWASPRQKPVFCSETIAYFGPCWLTKYPPCTAIEGTDPEVHHGLCFQICCIVARRMAVNWARLAEANSRRLVSGCCGEVSISSH